MLVQKEKNMKILMICGVYDENHESEILSISKGYVEQSANIFQKKLIRGIEQNDIDYQVISAPLVGAYPMRSKKYRIKAFSSTPKCTYVSFNNLWGVRNFSRTVALKRAIRAYLSEEKEDDFCILVYCTHTPFLRAAMYAKSIKPKSKVCLVVPDLPQYMNLTQTKRGLYDVFKKLDIFFMEKYIKKVDSFVLLTEPMKEVLKVGNRPYLVVEGLIDDAARSAEVSDVRDGIKRIVYTGKMNIRFGIKNLVDSFMKIQGDEYRLILCGDGDAVDYVKEKATIDGRIEYKGMVSASQAQEYIKSADVLVNPRPNDEEYTKYSFPSKNIEYLMTGKPVVAYMLDGMPSCYADYIYIIPNGYKCFEDVLLAACAGEKCPCSFREYAEQHLSAKHLIGECLK